MINLTWLSHLNECPELLCGLSCDHRWSQTIPMRNSPWEKRILQGITISLGPAILWVVWWPGRSCTLRRVQVLVFINRHSPTMNLVEEKQRGLIPPGLQSWPLQLIEHFSNTTSVAPPPAGPAVCRPLYLLHLLNLSFTIRAPNGSAYSNLGRTKVLYATSLVLQGAKDKFLRRKPKVLPYTKRVITIRH